MKVYTQDPTEEQRFHELRRYITYIEKANLINREKMIECTLNASEKQQLVVMMLMALEMPNVVDRLLKRGALTKKEAGDLRRASTLIAKVHTALLSKLPIRIVKSIINLIDYNEIRFESKSAKVYEMISSIKTEDVYTLAEGTLQTCQDECDGKKESCKYRMALESLGVPKLSEEAIGCPYYYEGNSHA